MRINNVNDNRSIRVLLTTTLMMAAAASGVTSAQETDIDRCARLESDAERLACFDAVMQRRADQTTPATPAKPATGTAAPEAAPPATAPAAAAPDASAPSAAPAAAAPNASAPSAAAAATASASGVAAPAAGETASASDYRYMSKEEKKAARRAEKERKKARSEYTAVVTGMRTRPHGQVAVTLDNGEEWSEQYASHGFLVRVGDTVTLKKSRFSSAYRLIDENGKGYSVTRLQ